MKIKEANSLNSIGQKTGNSEILFLFLIFVLSFLIRIIGLRFGEPLLTYWNELNILDPVYEMTINRTLNPNNFKRPDQILYLLNFVYLNVISFLKTGHSFAASYQTDQYSYFVYSRIMIAAFGSLIPIVAYKIGKESPINFAVPAALLFAFFPTLRTLFALCCSRCTHHTFYFGDHIIFNTVHSEQEYQRSLSGNNLFGDKYCREISGSDLIWNRSSSQFYGCKHPYNKPQIWSIVRKTMNESLKYFRDLCSIAIHYCSQSFFSSRECHQRNKARSQKFPPWGRWIELVRKYVVLFDKIF